MARSYEGAPSTSAALIQLARLKAGLSQQALAERAGVPATMVSAYERDRRQPTLPTLMRLVEAAGFEIRMRLEPIDRHDAILAAREAGRTPEERAAFEREVDRWRGAEPAGAPR
jgi:transcriptional regulator with XRE-family HTH domain